MNFFLIKSISGYEKLLEIFARILKIVFPVFYTNSQSVIRKITLNKTIDLSVKNKIWFAQKMIVDDTKRCYYRRMGNQRAGRLTLFIGGANPPDERKEGVANVCYILWFNSDWDIHLRPCWSLLWDFQGKTKIAAITRNNDGCYKNS